MGLSSEWRVAIRKGGGKWSEKRDTTGSGGEKKKGSTWNGRAVIFIKNVPRGSDASYKIVATNSREITSASA